MSKSYRIRTNVGVDTSLKVLIEQEFEYLEILSLKILQSDIYTRQCADYGVVVGRVSVNNGFGIPNAKLSVFIPIDSEDQANPIISELYPYKSLIDVNDDGYRYNLLPYVKSYSAHVPTGTFFTRNDVLTNPALIQVYDKYYKYNAVTNDSGDFMIFGVPVGTHTLVMDVDLSDIGEFSLSPQDLVRMGLATEAQVSGTEFKSSSNLRELPQIVSLNKTINVEPLWGQPEICNLGITRTDFDLSAEANIDIRPTSIFIGSIISGPNSSSVSSGCRPPNTSGHLCNLTAGPGEILAIRQTINQDSNGLPVLETFNLEGGGKVIDENGTWMIDVPMNLDYYTTNEFGEQVLSNDPEVGVPTRGKYRFKVKWSQSPSLSETSKRGYFLVPNIKEYNQSPESVNKSYAFSVDWNDYGTVRPNSNLLDANGQIMVQSAIDCDDKFYLMQYNKVYTVSQFINGISRGSGFERYIGIKNILDEACAGDNNRFPTNDGNFRFDILYIIFMFFSIILTPVFFALILVMHILYFVVWFLRLILLPVLAVYYVTAGLFFIIGAISSGVGFTYSPGVYIAGTLTVAVGVALGLITKLLWKLNLSGVKVPILTYPDCNLCSCSLESSVNENIGDGVGAPSSNIGNKVKPCQSILSNTDVTSVTLSPGILPLFSETVFNIPTRNPDNPTGYLSSRANVYKTELTGLMYDAQFASTNIGAPILVQTDGGTSDWRYIYSTNIPIADRVNLFNVKAKYFNGTSTTPTNINNPGGGVNRISVNFQPGQTTTKHYDNTIVILCSVGTAQNLIAGQLISFQSPEMSKDVNLKKGVINVYGNNAITGVTSTGFTTINVSYANPDGSGTNIPVTYQVNITANTTNNYHKFPTDIEYFQVITGMTYSQFSGQCGNEIGYDSLNNRYLNNISFIGQEETDNGNSSINESDNVILKGLDYIDDHENICVLILNRGVDPYTPKVPISYGLGRLFGFNNESGKMVTGYYHMNIPIQGGFLNISHDETQFNQILVSGITTGSNVSGNYYALNQNLYFNSFSYRPQIDTLYGQLTGYTSGQPYVYNGIVNSGYSGFNSNLISYYSSIDNTSIGYQAQCGGNVNNTRPIVPGAVAYNDYQYGLKIDPANRFTWIIYENNGPLSTTVNYLDSNHKYSPGTIDNQGYFPKEIIEGGPLMETNLNLRNNYQDEPRWKYDVTNRDVTQFYVTSNYYSPIYDTTGNTLNFTLGLSGNQVIMRADRLPSSTNVDEYCCNAMILQKNSDFQIYLIPEDGVLNITSSQSSTGSAGSGNYDYLYQDYIASTGITRIFDSFTCNGSVNLGCYGCKPTTPNGPNTTIDIKSFDCQTYLGETIFEYGCYRFVSTIFLSLVKDWSLMFEWIARNMVMLGACRNVFSHRFVNNWVNGVLYAFPFKNEVRGFTSPSDPNPNQPIPDYCDRAVILHPQTKNFYYRSTPYNISGDYFKTTSVNTMGFPTTIMDLGPRSNYLQELVMSDEYDGYVVNRLDSSTYGTVDDILNLFIVSRFVGTADNVTKLIVKSNILAYFSNSRPGTSLQIDADYAQLISINSELGVAPFLGANYPDNPIPGIQNPIFFNCDNVMGIFFSSDTQIRDYITPKRTIINPNGTVTSNCTFNNFPVYSQRVPFSQWEINDTDYIFGSQANSWSLSLGDGTIFSHPYQSMDRLQQNSRYFRTDGSTLPEYQKGYIYAVNNLGDLSASSLFWDKNTPPPTKQLVTVGAPYHFYFGLRRGASSFDRFRTKWINTNVVVN
jgi:hypothetical protein